MGVDPSLTLDQELASINTATEYPWRDYYEAFAA
jgi:hypothetical protein